MLIGIKRKAKWQPRTNDAQPPVAFVTGSGLFTWTRSLEAAAKDVQAFNANQRRRVGKGAIIKPDGTAVRLKPGVTLWAVVGWGIAGYPETVRILEGGQQ
jgi:hypothetical protein